MGTEDEFTKSSRPSPEDNTPDADYTEAAAAFFSEIEEGDIDSDGAQRRLEQLGIQPGGDTEGTNQPVDDENGKVIDLKTWRERNK